MNAAAQASTGLAERPLGVYRDPRKLADIFTVNHCPEPQLTVWEWADRYRTLAREASAEVGRYSTDRVPYWRAIMEDLSPSSSVRDIVVAKCAQVGFTEVLINFIGYCVHLAPGPLINVQPTEDMMKRNVEQRIEPMLRDTPEIAAKMSSFKTRGAGNRTLNKRFVGGMATFVGANSPAPLRAMPARYVLLDEVDGYPSDAGGEGHPCELAAARAFSYSHNRKVLEGSTPTIKDRSRIWARLAESDERVYNVPCPHCGEFQPLVFERLRWPSGKPEEVHYECAGCFQPILEHEHKTDMLTQGEWFATREYRGVRGYRINGLYSPLGWLGWAEIAEKFEAAKRSPSKLKTFVNTVLGEPWEERGDAPPHQVVYDKCRFPYSEWTAPEGVLVVTAGIDVQRDRFEVELLGWGRDGRRTWSIAYEVIPGGPLDPQAWIALRQILEREIPCASGGALRVFRAAIDTGDQTQQVYNWCRTAGSGLVSAIKGHDRWEQPIFTPSRADVVLAGSRKIIRRALQLWPLGVSRIKRDFYEQVMLQLEGGEVFHHWPERSEDHFRGLFSEVIITENNRNGYPVRRFRKVYERNEPLDCRVYAIGAFAIAKLNLADAKFWDAQEKITRRDLPLFRLPSERRESAEQQQPQQPPAPPPQPAAKPLKRGQAGRIKSYYD